MKRIELNESIIETNTQTSDEDWAKNTIEVQSILSSDVASVGTHLNDTMIGDSFGNILYAQGGNDILVGAKGNDSLYGGQGNDYYVYSKGDGHDIINDSSGYDFIVFNNDIHHGNVNIHQAGDDLEVTFSNLLSDKITIVDYYLSNIYKIDEAYYYSEFYNAIEGDNFGNTLFGDSYSNKISGYAQNDMLWGYGGDDFLDGGKGNDTLDGGEGSDTYFFKPGDGYDIIYDYGISGTDRILFDSSIAQEDVQITYYDFLAEVQYTPNDKVTIYSGPQSVEQFEYGGHTSPLDINKIINDITAYDASQSGVVPHVNEVASSPNQLEELQVYWS